MNRTIIILYTLTALLLCGCSSNIFSSRRDMERLRPIQTIGLDGGDSAVTLSVSSGIGPDGASPLVMRATGSGMEDAVERLQEYSPEDELFYAHVSYILLGESMANGGVLPLLDWVERSPSMRMDTAVFVVKGRAENAVIGASAGEGTDVTDRLSSLERDALLCGRHIYTLREVASSLLERGSALCSAVQAAPSAGTDFTQGETLSYAVVPDGYAVLSGDSLATYLTPEESLGSELLSGYLNGTRALVEGNMLELIGGEAHVSGVWDDSGTLTGLVVTADVGAGILERQTGGEEDIEALQRALAETVQGWLEAAVAREQSLGCDFLVLENDVLRSAPCPQKEARAAWEKMFTALPVTVAAEARIDRSYDLADTLGGSAP